MSISLDEYTGRWDYGTLPANVALGLDCYLERAECFEVLRRHETASLLLGDRVRIYTWTTFNLEPGARVEIGDDSVVAGAIFMCAERISVGRRVAISYNVTIADSDFHPIDPEERRLDAVCCSPQGNRAERPPLIARPVEIGDDVRIGIGAIILKGVTIGRGARIGAGAVVTSDVPEAVTVAGNPARLV